MADELAPMSKESMQKLIQLAAERRKVSRADYAQLKERVTRLEKMCIVMYGLLDHHSTSQMLRTELRALVTELLWPVPVESKPEDERG